MNIEFLYHISINAIIFYVICSGFKFFLKISSTIDFSYLWIVIFSAYFWFYLNINYGYWLLLSIFLSFLSCIPFMAFLLYISTRLKWVYFLIGTLSVYMLMLNLVANLESFTWWVFGISLNTQHIWWNIWFNAIDSFFWWYLIVFFIISIFLFYIRKAFFYKILKWWGENESSLKCIWYKTLAYKFIMITITALLASIGWNLYGYYNAYIEPNSFWIIMLNMILIISLVSYKLDSIGTLLVSFLIIWTYEYIRFFKFVDPSLIWYLREMIFGCIVMWSVYIVFKYTKLGRQL